MKRMLTAVLALLLALSLCACGAQDTDDTPTYRRLLRLGDADRHRPR